ncbi:MAG: hydroxymethylbilane synthase [Betaproteobacteria bacterium]|jgi:hydroxymethylbilane synthase
MNHSILLPQKLVIASRESRLAMWQAEHVKALLEAIYPECDVSILGMTTRGDQILDQALSKIGGKGLFIKELENALLGHQADLAVHSLKDMPMEIPLGFALGAVLSREDSRDAFVSNEFAQLRELPAGAVVGTSSLRREAQIRKNYPHLKIQALRGNLDTRLAKLDRGEYAAIILAAAGLKRLGLASRIKSFLSIEESLPAAGQGALGIEILSENKPLFDWLRPLIDNKVTLAVSAEREVSRRLGGSCEVPIAVYANWHKDNSSQLELRALLADPTGTQLITASSTQAITSLDEALILGQIVADQLIAQGGQQLVDSLSV